MDNLHNYHSLEVRVWMYLLIALWFQHIAFKNMFKLVKD